ncbi:DNA translocase FtsK [Roseomonas elaeocarpi]|uniref:DNA translocase FtsK n=1 Tax=Roseomonas elaeocarpi TaxID=907779 RepID=A0ABV6JMM3_9PROT
MPRSVADRSPSPDGRLTGAAQRFASPAVKAAMRRRGAEFLGVVLGLMGLALVVALLSYDSRDPSLSTATARATHNLAGPVGATVSDVLLQGFGWAGWLPAACLLCWALRLGTHNSLKPFAGRVAAMLAALPILAAVALSLGIPGTATMAPGGAAGRLVHDTVDGVARGSFGPFGGTAATGALVVLSLLLGFVALGVPLLAWRRAGRVAATGSLAAARGGVTLGAELSSRAARRRERLARSGRRGAGLGALLRPFQGLLNRQRPASPDLQRLLSAADAAAEAPAGSRRPAPRIRVPRDEEEDGRPTLRGRPEEPLDDEVVAPRPMPRPMPRAASRAGGIAGGLAGGLSGVLGLGRRDRDEDAPEQRRIAPRLGGAAVGSSLGISRRPAREPDPELLDDEAEDEALRPNIARTPPRPAPTPPRRLTPQPAEIAKVGFQLPPLELLSEAPRRRDSGPTEEALQNNARLLESVLEDYGVRGRIGEVRPGPVVTLYELEPAPGTKSARVIGLADDVARSMCVTAVRIATVPGRNVIGIEMPNAKRETVYLRELLADTSWDEAQGRLNLALGKDIGGSPVIADLATMPHLLVAGTTGSGKSVAINTMILSLLYRYRPDECRFIMIDPKMLELSVYDRIPHLLAPVVTESPKAIGALKWTVREMERRYRALSQLGVRNIAGYNKKVAGAREKGEVLTRRVQTGFDPDTGKPVFEDLPLALEPLPMIVVVIDEMADLMVVAGKEIEASVQRLAQMARAAGIHVVMATQRPSVDVITGVIKANFPARISFQVSSKIDSRTILGEQGAEQLLGQGDMLFMAGVGRMNRVHGPFVSDAEVEAVVEFLREQGEPAYIEEVTEVEDDGDAPTGAPGGGEGGERGLYEQAVDLVTREGKASTSFVQRHLNIGYNRAAKLIEQMEKEGVVGPANHVGKREVLTRGRED